MNKEEIEKDDNYWKGYIQKQKEAEEICKMCNYRNKYKEAKETLDKVTDKLKEMNSKYTKEYKNVENLYLIEQDVSILQELSCVLDDVEEILNIIEGEREYCCTCGVELNSKNKALNNMCNECKYGLDYQKEREEK